MKPLRVLLRRFTGLFQAERGRREISAELASHLELHMDDYVRAGMSPKEARRAAMLKLGSLAAAEEAYRDQSSLPLIENLWRDLRFTLRQLAANPVFGVTAIIVLSLGIAAASAIFAFVDAALVRPLPYPSPSRLVAVNESSKLFPRNNLSYLDYLDWKRENTIFASFDVYTGSGFLLSTPGGGVEPINAARVSESFFQTLGIGPALGRISFKPNEPSTVVLSHALWQSRFAGNPGVVGQTLVMSGEQYTIIGVLPASFQFAPRGEAQLWTPLQTVSGCETRRSCHDLDGIARLKPGVTAQTALTQMKIIAAELERRYPDSNRGQSASVEPLANVIVGSIRPVLLMLMAAVTLLLVIAVTNVISLLLLRSEARRQEMAIRTSLGATRGRLVFQFMMEGFVLAAIAAAAGLLTAHATCILLVKLIPPPMLLSLPFLAGLGVNLHVVAFALLIALVSTLGFAVTPLWLIPRSDLRSNMASGNRWSAGLSWRRLGSKLVVVELATALVLLVSAGLLGKSLYLLLRVDLGFAPDRLAALTVAAPNAQYRKPEEQAALGRRLLDELAAVPGIENVSVTSVLPVTCNCNTDWIRVVGKPFDGTHEDVLERDIGPQYFSTLGAALVRGRFFSDADDAAHPNVIIVNQAFVRKYFPGEDAVGRQIGDLQLTPKSIRQIVGVVNDVREGSLNEDVWPAEYEPFAQSPDTYFQVIVRTRQDERAMLPALRAQIRRGEPQLGVSDETSLSDRILNSRAAYLKRSSTWLAAGFALLALTLSVIGLYGVVAYSVGCRTREIGVRMALGARRPAVVWMVLKEAGRLVLFGIAAGLALSLGLSKLLRQLLFNVQPWDAATLAAVSVTLALAAGCASVWPALRASHTNPVDALRIE